MSKPFFVLAPMDDVTDTVFRQIVASCAAPDLYVSEFINVDGLQSPGRDKLMPKVRFSETDHPLVGQLWGLKPANFESSAYQFAVMGYEGIDINMGCPDKTVVKNGACSALITNRPLAVEIINACRQGLVRAANETGKMLPLSVKTRLGAASIDMSWLDFLLQQKLDALTVHFRTRAEMSKVPAHWDQAAEVITLRDSINPATRIIGNGDVRNRQHGLELVDKYGVDGIMIGRAVFADPYCFADASPWENMAKADRIALFRRHVELFAANWPNGERKLHTLNRFCKVYINGFEGAKELRETIMAAPTISETLKITQAARDAKLS